MRKLLSLILSVSLLCFSLNSNCFAKTAFLNNQERIEKSYSLFKQRDGERLVVQGEDGATFVINNKCQSESKASASSSSGGLMSKILPFAVKLTVLFLGARFAWNKLSHFSKFLSTEASQALSSLMELLTAFPKMFEKSQEDTKEEHQGEEQEKSNQSIWEKTLRYLKNFTKNIKWSSTDCLESNFVRNTPISFATVNF